MIWVIKVFDQILAGLIVFSNFILFLNLFYFLLII